jgi:hypothetical protein
MNTIIPNLHRLAQSHHVEPVADLENSIFQIDYKKLYRNRISHSGNFCAIWYDPNPELDIYYVIPYQVCNRSRPYAIVQGMVASFL